MTRKLKGSAIQANTITITQIQTTAVTNIVAQAGPRVSSLIYPGNDTAGNTVGGQTVYINGSGFETNNAIYINGNAVPSKSFISASNLSFTTPALAAGIYPVYVINTDSGATAIFVPGYISSAEPTWVSSSSLAEVGADQAILGSDGTTGAYDIAYRSGQGLSIGRYNTAWDSTFSWSPSINTWYHIVWCRSGSSLRAFVDGVQIGSTATNTNAYNGGTNYSVIGASDASNTRSLNGFLDDLRITKGYARYTSNFTAPTAALKDK